MNDPEVVGFKSSAAYQSGLDVQPLNAEELAMKCEVAYRQVRDYPPGRFRVERREIVEWLINATCSNISGQDKPCELFLRRYSTEADAGTIQYSFIPGRYRYPNVIT